MANLPRIFTVVVTVFIVAGCGREPLPVYPPVIPTVQLLQYMEIDTVAGGTPDTTLVLKFEYDVLKRLVALNTYYSTDSANQLLHYEKYTYQYNSIDTFPSVMIYTSREGSAADSTTHKDTSYYTYSTIGRILTDSTSANFSGSLGSGNRYTSRRYSYLNGYFIVRTTEGENGSINQSYDSVVVGTNGSNINSISSYTFSLPDSLPVFSFTASVEYDNYANPFRRTPALYANFPLFGYDSGFGALRQLNNATTIAKNNSNGEASSESVTYRYSDNGYPSGFSSVYSNSGTVRTYKGVFIYN